MSLRNPLISVYAIDLNQAKELVDKLSITSVPTLAVKNDLLTPSANEWVLAQVIQRYGLDDEHPQ